MAFCWRADDGPTLNADLVLSFAIIRESGPVLLENPTLITYQKPGENSNLTQGNKRRLLLGRYDKQNFLKNLNIHMVFPIKCLFIAWIFRNRNEDKC